MKRTLATFLTAAALAAGTINFTAATAKAQKAGTANEAARGLGSKGLEGSWSVLVTIRNCSTGDAIRTFRRLATFSRGGTMQEFAAAGTALMPARRSPGHGVWSYLGDQSFSYSLQFLLLTTDGGFAGTVREQRSVAVDDTGDHFTATGTGQVYDVNDQPTIATCATEEGTRFP